MLSAGLEVDGVAGSGNQPQCRSSQSRRLEKTGRVQGYRKKLRRMGGTAPSSSIAPTTRSRSRRRWMNLSITGSADSSASGRNDLLREARVSNSIAALRAGLTGSARPGYFGYASMATCWLLLTCYFIAIPNPGHSRFDRGKALDPCLPAGRTNTDRGLVRSRGFPSSTSALRIFSYKSRLASSHSPLYEPEPGAFGTWCHRRRQRRTASPLSHPFMSAYPRLDG